MIRKFINSNVEIVRMENISGLAPDVFVIQNERINDNLQLIESCLKKDICELIPFSTQGISNGNITQNTYSDEKIEEYGHTILNNDPFFKYSGHELKDIIEAKDVAWINKALKEMRNEYIKTRIEYLAKANKLI